MTKASSMSGRVVVYGESLIDLVEVEADHYVGTIGGSPYNVARALGLQRTPTTYLSPLSVDHLGDKLREGLRQAEVRTTGATSQLPTSVALISLTEREQPKYTLYRTGVADRDISLADINRLLPSDIKIFHCGSLVLVPAEIEKTIAIIDSVRSVQPEALICIDLNLRPTVVGDNQAYAEAIESVIPHAHLIKLSDEDLDSLSFGRDPEKASQEILSRMTEMPASVVVITLGEAGCLIRTIDRCWREPLAASVEVVDTVGAGDCFQAGMIAWLFNHGILNAKQLEKMEQKAWQACLRHASLTAAYTVQQQGCVPPTYEQMEDLAAHAR